MAKQMRRVVKREKKEEPEYTEEYVKELVSKETPNGSIKKVREVPEAYAQDIFKNIENNEDSNIFLVDSSDIDKKIEQYGFANKTEFVDEFNKLLKSKVFIVPVDYMYCTHCGKYKEKSSFFNLSNEVHKKGIPICRECANKMFKYYADMYKDARETIIIFSSYLNIIVVSSLLDKFAGGLQQDRSNVMCDIPGFVEAYIDEVISECDKLKIPKNQRNFHDTNFSGIPFKVVEPSFSEPIYNDKFVAQEEEAEEAVLSKKMMKLKEKWGDYLEEDLLWLEGTYKDWYDKCDISGISRDKLVRQLCFEELSINKARENGENVKDKIKSFRELMKDGDFTPKKQNSQASHSQFSSMGDFIRYAEKNRPIINKDPDFEDVDGIQKIWRSIAGAISRTIGKNTEYVKDLEDNYKEYTADILNSQPEIEGDSNAKEE